MGSIWPGDPPPNDGTNTTSNIIRSAVLAGRDHATVFTSFATENGFGFGFNAQFEGQVDRFVQAVRAQGLRKEMFDACLDTVMRYFTSRRYWLFLSLIPSDRPSLVAYWSKECPGPLPRHYLIDEELLAGRRIEPTVQLTAPRTSLNPPQPVSSVNGAQTKVVVPVEPVTDEPVATLSVADVLAELQSYLAAEQELEALTTACATSSCRLEQLQRRLGDVKAEFLVTDTHVRLREETLHRRDERLAELKAQLMAALQTPIGQYALATGLLPTDQLFGRDRPEERT